MSINSVKLIGCLVGLPMLLAAALRLQLGTGGQIVFWLLGIALAAGIFVFMKSLLDERGLPLTFVLPGSLMLVGAIFVATLTMILSNGQANAAFCLAVLIAGFASALWHNAKGLGPGDGIVVTFLQLCLSLIIVGAIVFWYFFAPKSSRR